MDQKSHDNFTRITRMEPEALSAGDIEFLKARRSYLTASDLERYGKLLGKPETESAPEEQESKPKKGK